MIDFYVKHILSAFDFFVTHCICIYSHPCSMKEVYFENTTSK